MISARRAVLKTAAAFGAAGVLGSWPALAAAPAPAVRLKFVSLLVRKEGITHAQFMDHWVNVHAPMAAKMPGMRGYILNEVIDRANGNFGSLPDLQDVDGVSETYFDSMDDRKKMEASPEAKQVESDGDTFRDRARSKSLVMHEHMYIRPRRGPDTIKRFGLMVRLPNLSRPEFMKHWLDIHGPMAHDVPGLSGFAISEFARDPSPQDFEGMVQGWSPSPEAVRKMQASLEYKVWTDDGDTFMDKKAGRGFVAKEYVIIDPHKG